MENVGLNYGNEVVSSGNDYERLERKLGLRRSHEVGIFGPIDPFKWAAMAADRVFIGGDNVYGNTNQAEKYGFYRGGKVSRRSNFGFVGHDGRFGHVISTSEESHRITFGNRPVLGLIAALVNRGSADVGYVREKSRYVTERQDETLNHRLGYPSTGFRAALAKSLLGKNSLVLPGDQSLGVERLVHLHEESVTKQKRDLRLKTYQVHTTAYHGTEREINQIGGLGAFLARILLGFKGYTLGSERQMDPGEVRALIRQNAKAIKQFEQTGGGQPDLLPQQGSPSVPSTSAERPEEQKEDTRLERQLERIRQFEESYPIEVMKNRLGPNNPEVLRLETAIEEIRANKKKGRRELLFSQSDVIKQYRKLIGKMEGQEVPDTQSTE